MPPRSLASIASFEIAFFRIKKEVLGLKLMACSFVGKEYNHASLNKT